MPLLTDLALSNYMMTNKLWDNLNNSKYFTYVAIAVLCIIKLLFDNLIDSNMFSAYSSIIETVAIYLYAVSVIHFLVFISTVALIHFWLDKSFDEWQQDNQGKRFKKTIDIVSKPALASTAIVIYGFLVYLTLYVFSWTEFIFFFGAMLAIKIFKTLNNAKPNVPRHE